MNSRRAAASRGFTLIELLVAMGLIALLAGLVVRGLGSGAGRGVALQSGQALLMNLVSAARTRAVASGHDVRLLVQADPRWPERFRRVVVMQETADGAIWTSLHEVELAKAVYFLPYEGRMPAGIFTEPEKWKKADGISTLHSSAFASATVDTQAGGAAVETWDFVVFTGKGMTSTSGDIVCAVGRLRAPGSYAPGESPVELDNPELVRGVSLSAYGLPNPINGRAGF